MKNKKQIEKYKDLTDLDKKILLYLNEWLVLEECGPGEFKVKDMKKLFKANIKEIKISTKKLIKAGLGKADKQGNAMIEHSEEGEYMANLIRDKEKKFAEDFLIRLSSGKWG